MWPARIIAALDGLALVQVPGGMLAVPDPTALLQVGDRTMIVWGADATTTLGLKFGPFTVNRSGNVAILRSADATVPLLLAAGDVLPDTVLFTVATAPAEYDEGVIPTPPPPPCPEVSLSEAVAFLNNDCCPDECPCPPVSREAALACLNNDCDEPTPSPTPIPMSGGLCPPCSSADALLFLFAESLQPQE